MTRELPVSATSALLVGVGEHTLPGARPRNEDYAACYLGTGPERLATGVIAALADGMGGARGGRVAAELAVRGFIDAALGQPATLGTARIGARAVDAVNRWIHAVGNTDAELNGMACTLSALVLCGGRAHVLHVGDSRIYRLRDEKLTLLTRDHTLGAPGTTHALTRAVGAQEILPVDHGADTARVHDRYLLCSDGVHGALSHQHLRSALCKRAAPRETAFQLVSEAAARADADNATAIVVDVLALPGTQYADLELAFADRPLRPPPRTGDVVDDYALVEMLGDGPYTRVFRATDLRDERAVILKFPKSRPGLDALLRTALLREAWIASHVHSPFVTEAIEPPIERRSCVYGVLPHYAGETLEQRLSRRPPLTLSAGLDIALKLAKAVAALHRAGIVHRDIKPDNVIVQANGGLKLIDLGVARLPQREASDLSSAPGTPSYMAPELFAGSDATEASDIFALGVTVYRAFTGGAYPYGEIAAFSQPRFSKITPLSRHRPDLPAWLDHILARAVATDPQARFGDTVEFAFELENGSLRAAPLTVGRVSLYDRNPTRFWQVVSALLLIALLVALARG
jgi:serine/threonine protein phosphatase PrpC